MLTYKRKLILTKAQESRMDSWLGVCRLTYNLGLEIRIAAWRNKQQSVSKYELMRQMKDIRTIEWVGDCPFECMTDAIQRLDKAYRNFYRSYKTGGGFPRFRSKRKHQSITFKTVRVDGSKVWIPKFGWLKIIKDSSIQGTPKIAIVKKEITGYYICITCKDVQRSIQNNDENQVIGIDMGVAHFAVDSNGVFIANPKHFKVYERQLRIENRSLARKKKGSSNWKKQSRKLALLHHKISNVRKDFLHKLSTTIAKDNHTVFIEDLNVKGMVRSNLSKHILDCGWSEFRLMLEYKTNVIAINPRYTSQTCNDCGAVDSKSRVSQSQFVCTSCGVESNADENAAKNILSKGMAHVRERKALV
jgi:putative transposase